MNMLNMHNAAFWPAAGARDSSVVLGEGSGRPIPIHTVASGVGLALLFAQLCSGLDHLRKDYAANALPDYFALADDDSGVPIKLRIVRVEESPFYFLDED